jgi:hypothetical protein
MLLTILLAALPQVQPSPAPTAKPAPVFVPGTFTRCVQTKAQQAGHKAVAIVPSQPRADARAAPLGELPSGGLHLTVVRTIGGCQVPTLIKDGYGFVPARPREDRLKLLGTKP